MKLKSIALELDEERPCKTVGELHEEFFRIMRVKQRELLADFQDKRFVLRPQALVLNPPGWGSLQDPTRSDIYIAVYYRGYYVRIECGRSMLFGPHKFELMFQVRVGLHVKLGGWTSCFPFHQERTLRKKLKKAILLKKFFVSEHTAAMVVEIGLPEKDDSIKL